jgi:N-acetylmuramic acid 6-phosphate etherase
MEDGEIRMLPPNTENLHDLAAGLELRPLDQVARILAEGQAEAARAVLPVIPAICAGAHAMARGLLGGGRLYYVAAGSSGLMAAADALELGGTFGVAPDRVRILMAGGLPTTAAMPGDTEDDISGLEEALDGLGPQDVMIAVAASGTTPYTVAAARIARARGATVVGLANNPGAVLLELADVAVLLETPPEVISGSTRMGAATAQKIALNTLSTLMAVELGHVYDGMMVNLVADNEKLRGRALAIVRRISQADERAATEALAAAGGDVKAAVLLAAGARSLSAVKENLDDTKGHLRGSLERLRAK